MEFENNVNKTKIIRFSKRKTPNNQYEFLLNGEKVEVVDDYVYLGTTVSHNGKYSNAIEKQVTQKKEGTLWTIKERNV